jgi:hypothetical protein
MHGESQIDQTIVVDFMVACFRHDPDTFIKSTLPIFLADTTPPLLRLILVKTCFLIATQEARLPWYPSIVVLYSTIASPLRAMLREFQTKGKEVTMASGDSRISLLMASDKKTKRKEEETVDRVDVLLNLLMLYRSDPLLAIHVSRLPS